MFDKLFEDLPSVEPKPFTQAEPEPLPVPEAETREEPEPQSPAADSFFPKEPETGAAAEENAEVPPLVFEVTLEQLMAL